MKKLIKYTLTTMLLSMVITTSAFADVISDAPFETEASATAQKGTTTPPPAVPQQTAAQDAQLPAPAAQTAAPQETCAPAAPAAAKQDTAVLVDSPDAGAANESSVSGPSPVEVSSGSSMAGPGAGSAGTAVSAPVSSGSVPGANYANTAKVSMNTGCTVVSPNHSSGGMMVAEGSVQLSNGSWESIGYDKHIRQPYFKLLREDGEWYVVEVTASRIGDYRTSDGSTVRELWLKKSDCTVRNAIDVNTSNATRQQIVRTALSLLGKGYKYAGNGPDAFDCSGFVNMVMSSAGVNVPRTSSEICNAGTQVGISGLRPGDIVGRPGHVGIYVGDGIFVHAAESSTGVVAESLEIYNRANAFTSYTNVVGD